MIQLSDMAAFFEVMRKYVFLFFSQESCLSNTKYPQGVLASGQNDRVGLAKYGLASTVGR
jgi:hypothetical protein